MKVLKLFSTLLLGFVAHYQIQAQTSACDNSYLPFREGISLELTNYDSKGKLKGTTFQQILGVSAIDGGFKTTVLMSSTNKKGKKSELGNFEMTCKGNSVFLDMRSMLDPEMTQNLREAKMEIDATTLEFPNAMIPGMLLPDGELTMKASMNGLTLLTIKIHVTNRKVEGTETVTTPAGTFECVKISEESDIQAVVRAKVRAVSWYAIGVGLVKTESYDKDGELESTTILTKFEK